MDNCLFSFFDLIFANWSLLHTKECYLSVHTSYKCSSASMKYVVKFFVPSC